MHLLDKHPIQEQYIQAMLDPKKRFIACCSSRRSGKTDLAVRVIANIAARISGNILIYADTLKQVKRIYVPKFNDIFNHTIAANCLLKKHHVADMVYEMKSGCKIYLGSAESLSTFEGNDYQLILADECSDLPPNSFPIDSGLRPTLSRTKGKAIMIGAPKRFGTSGGRYKEIFYEWERGNNDPNSPYCAFTWTADGLLDPDELASVKASMDPKDFIEQYQGTFQSITGGVYYCFTQENTISNTHFIDTPILVTCDFNVNPMFWTIAQIQDGTLVFLDEQYLRNTNTHYACERLQQYLIDHNLTQEVIFYGDAAGNQRRTSAVTLKNGQVATDWNIIRQYFPNSPIMVPPSNPPIERRVASMNGALRNKSILIDLRCKYLCRDLESVNYKQGTNQIDTSNKDLTHGSDSASYLSFAKFGTMGLGVPKFNPGNTFVTKPKSQDPVINNLQIVKKVPIKQNPLPNNDILDKLVPKVKTVAGTYRAKRK